MSIARLEVDPDNRIVMHCHASHLLAMSFTHELDERSFSRTLWQMCTECLVVFQKEFPSFRGWFREQMRLGKQQLKNERNSIGFMATTWNLRVRKTWMKSLV